jgi:SAM-dependent methyltransferase
MAAEDTFDWIVPFEALSGLLQPPTRGHGYDSRMLVLGCGNSTLSASLWRAGFTDVTSVDYRPEGIDQMRAAHADTPALKWDVADVLSCPHMPSGGFDIAVDKGMLDWFVAAEGTGDSVAAYLREVKRMLAPGGVLAIVSFHPPVYMAGLLGGCPLLGYESRSETDGGGSRSEGGEGMGGRTGGGEGMGGCKTDSEGGEGMIMQYPIDLTQSAGAAALLAQLVDPAGSRGVAGSTGNTGSLVNADQEIIGG